MYEKHRDFNRDPSSKYLLLTALGYLIACLDGKYQNTRGKEVNIRLDEETTLKTRR